MRPFVATLLAATFFNAVPALACMKAPPVEMTRVEMEPEVLSVERTVIAMDAEVLTVDTQRIAMDAQLVSVENPRPMFAMQRPMLMAVMLVHR